MFLYPPSCVHRDRRPDLNSKRRPFTSFCFFVLKVFIFVPVSCLSRGMEVAARYSRHSPLQVGVGVWRDRRECRESTGREPSCPRIAEISAAGGGSPKPAGGLPSSRVAAPPGAPFAGYHATGPPLTQCPPARL